VKRIACQFSGRVQGVGFRATARSIASGFEISGWVRNEPDGTVRVEAQGSPEQLDAFVQMIEEQMAGLIRQTNRHEIPVVESERSFEIRY